MAEATLIDFEPVTSKAMTLDDLAAQYNNSDLAAALIAYVDFTRQILSNVTDEQATYIPDDPDANDTFAATEEERHVGWSLVHLVAHVTASAEEGAAFSSLLARGIAIGGRLRHEQDWQEITTVVMAVSRLEECQRICLGYLATWPDSPDLETKRILQEGASWSPPNAAASFMRGLSHWNSHVTQFQNTAEQARQHFA